MHGGGIVKLSGASIIQAVTGGFKKLLSKPELPATTPLSLPAVGVRNGMWAFSAAKQHVGIVTGVVSDGLVEFHLVTPDRITASVSHVPITDLRQARLNEIPLTSRPDAVKGERMGYL